MLKLVALVIAILIVGVLFVTALQPNVFRVQRSVTIAAAPRTIVPLIEDFHAWGQWSPYEVMDPQMSRTFEGSARGVGAIYGWSSRKIGQGRMEILEVTPSRIVIKLDFLKPFEAHNIATYTLEAQGDGVLVTWSMEGPNSFLGKLMHLVVNMDKMVGKDFETGLANLKQAAEART